MSAVANHPHLAVLGMGERTHDGDTTLVVRSTCPGCQKATDITVVFAELRHYLDGALIQRAMPSLPSAQRELVISGTCDDCWDKMFDARGDR